MNDDNNLGVAMNAVYVPIALNQRAAKPEFPTAPPHRSEEDLALSVAAQQVFARSETAWKRFGVPDVQSLVRKLKADQQQV